ncbi:MAG: hypothetical protein QGH42_00710 [Kiritimatiellia bacterium]|jgi:hypothetical protein|nr:hypothetical protein [Kiritimatiellia bacterium]MDP6810253.1 hypothetical protein [Kiritimatiellia bacterium]MDP7022758.1 hypothetical protein [Kiritimatiellia bacterium]
MMGDQESRGGAVSRLAEVIVSLGVIVLFIALVSPAWVTANRHRDIVRLVASGERLREAIVSANVNAELVEDVSPLWPTNNYASSTEYFVEFFESDLYTNAFPAGWLAAPGVPQFVGTNTLAFTATNNAWCIAVPVEGQTNDFPFLFTRNLSLGKAPEKRKISTVDEITQLDPERTPFGGGQGIVISYKGTVQVIKARELSNEVRLPERFNPTGATNEFLTPWSQKRTRTRRRQ